MNCINLNSDKGFSPQNVVNNNDKQGSRFSQLPQKNMVEPRFSHFKEKKQEVASF